MSSSRVSTGALVLTLAAATIGILVSVQAATGSAASIRALRAWQEADGQPGVTLRHARVPEVLPTGAAGASFLPRLF